MSLRPRGQRGSRALALISVGAVVAALLGVGTTTATAVTRSDDSRVAVKPTPTRALGAGRYVVVLSQPSATRYTGGVPGLPATRAKAGTPFNARSAGVTAYSRYLSRQQAKLANKLGIRMLSNTTLATNCFHGEIVQAAGDSPVGRPPGPDAGEGQGVQARHVEHPDVPGPGRSRGTVGPAGWRGDSRGRRRRRHPRLGHLARVRLLRRQQDHPEPHRGARHVPPGQQHLPAQGRRRHLPRCLPARREVGRRTTATASSSAPGTTPQSFLDTTKPQERYSGEYLSARDGDGHGSHTASTAAGNYGVPATVEGQDFGTVSGHGPRGARSPPTRSASATTTRTAATATRPRASTPSTTPSSTGSTSSTTPSPARPTRSWTRSSTPSWARRRPASSWRPRRATAVRPPPPWLTTARG